MIKAKGKGIEDNLGKAGGGGESELIDIVYINWAEPKK